MAVSKHEDVVNAHYDRKDLGANILKALKKAGNVLRNLEEDRLRVVQAVLTLLP